MYVVPHSFNVDLKNYVGLNEHNEQVQLSKNS